MPKLFDGLSFKINGKQCPDRSKSDLLKHIVENIFALPVYSAASETEKKKLSDAIQSTVIVTKPGDMFLLAQWLCGRRISLASEKDKLRLPKKKKNN